MADVKLEALLSLIPAHRNHIDGSHLEWVRATSRDDWRNKRGNPGPSLNIYVGPNGGMLICSTPDGDGLHTTGGNGTEPVLAKHDLNGGHIFPPGSEIPLDRLIEAVREFHEKPGPPTTVDWVAWDHENSPMVFFDDDGNETGRSEGDEFIEATP